jgi:hypothetical protein
MTAPIIYSIAVSSPRGLAAPAARDPPRLSRHRGGPRPRPGAAPDEQRKIFPLIYLN